MAPATIAVAFLAAHAAATTADPAESTTRVLLMKMKAGSAVFKYESSYWTDDNAYDEGTHAVSSEWADDGDDADTKLPAFSNQSISALTLCYRTLANCYTYHLGQVYSSAKELFSAGYVGSDNIGHGSATSEEGKKAWTGLFLPPEDPEYARFWNGGSGTDCAMQRPGINTQCNDHNSARIGYCVNQPTQGCVGGSGDSDSPIGIGLQTQSFPGDVNSPFGEEFLGQGGSEVTSRQHQAWLFAGDVPEQPTASNETLTPDAQGAFPVRLVGGSSNLSGRLEVLYNGQWGTVCDDGFGTTDAEVVCRQLGFGAGAEVGVGSFGQGSGQIWLDNVACAGSESGLSNCSHNGWGAHNCLHSEDVGIECTAVCIPASVCRRYRFSPRKLRDDSDPRVALAEIEFANIGGIVAIDSVENPGGFSFAHEAPGNVIDGSVHTKWLDFNRQPLVMELCFDGGPPTAFRFTTANDAPERDPVQWTLEVEASGEWFAVHSQTTDFQTPATRLASIEWVSIATTPVRLVDGSSPLGGRLEVYHDCQWGTICNGGFAAADAEVVCRQLGFAGGAEVGVGSFGQGSGQIWLDQVDCDGSESDLSSCSHGGWGVHHCSHAEDVGVECLLHPVCTTTDGSGLSSAYPCTCGDATCAGASDVCDANVSSCALESCSATGGSGLSSFYPCQCGNATCTVGDDVCDAALSTCATGVTPVRLVDGLSPLNGRLEVYYDGQWGSVCDDRFEGEDAQVVCRQLGFVGGEVAGRSMFGRGTDQTWLDEVACIGNESALSDCPHRGWGEVTGCDHTEDVGIQCQAVCNATDGSGIGSLYPCTCGGSVCTQNHICNASSSTCTMAACDAAGGFGLSSGYPCACGSEVCGPNHICDGASGNCTLAATCSWYRFTPTKLRDDSRPNVQLAEFEFADAEGMIAVESAESPGGESPGREGPEKAIDGHAFTKWLSSNRAPLAMLLCAHEGPPVAFRFTTGDDSPGRDPVQWILEVEADGAWFPLHTQSSDFEPPTSRGVPTEWIAMATTTATTATTVTTTATTTTSTATTTATTATTAAATMAPTGMPTPSPAGVRPAVLVRTTLQGVDYDLLVGHQEAYSAFETAVRMALADVAGPSVGQDQVGILVAQGSVVVTAEISVSDAGSDVDQLAVAEGIRQTMQAANMNERIVESIRQAAASSAALREAVETDQLRATSQVTVARGLPTAAPTSGPSSTGPAPAAPAPAPEEPTAPPTRGPSPTGPAPAVPAPASEEPNASRAAGAGALGTAAAMSAALAAANALA